MKATYTAPYIKLVMINQKDVITQSYMYDGGEIDAGGNMGGGVDLPSIPGLVPGN